MPVKHHASQSSLLLYKTLTKSCLLVIPNLSLEMPQVVLQFVSITPILYFPI